MTKKTLVQIRTNSNLTVSYQDLTLSPEIELILLCTEPQYQVKGSKITKGHALAEFRVKTDPDGIAKMIGELQALQVQLMTLTNMSEQLNTVIRNSTERKPPII